MSLVLYVKSWCPWCVAAIRELDALGVPYTVRDLEKDTGATAEMRSLSGQTRVPTLEAAGAVLADFGPEELAPFLQKHGILPAHPHP
jgi:glutaredoxin 3